ncbi:CDP-archaeol synthase [uncultured archaeon]|nr:CDP-archaeol synthase [uncultured archaeon]
MLDPFVRLLLFILPAYVANAAPVVLGGLFPIDGGRRAWDGRPYLGSSKTWLGLAGGLVAGLLAAVLEAHLLIGTPYDLWAGQGSWYLLTGLLLSAGALAGDLLGSFAKRRLGLGAGQASWLLDQLPFVLVAMLAVLPLGVTFQFEPLPLAALLVLTVVLHRAANWLAHRSGLKKVPW